MDKADEKELEAYQVQLSQVELALQSDPESTELTDLSSELKTLIELTEESIRQKSSQNAQSKTESSRKALQLGVAGKTWAAGDECLAKYSQDGQFYPARITSVGGAEDNRVYSIVFKGYNTTELVKANEVKPLSASYLSGPGPYRGGGNGNGGGTSSNASSGKRKQTNEDDEERERRKRKNEKKLELRAAKAKEQNEKKASWQKFAKKAEKKGVHIAGVAGTSIFKTPDNPYGKVGVTGSGKGMTENRERPKNKFAADSNEVS